MITAMPLRIPVCDLAQSYRGGPPGPIGSEGSGLRFFRAPVTVAAVCNPNQKSGSNQPGAAGQYLLNSQKLPAPIASITTTAMAVFHHGSPGPCRSSGREPVA